MELNEYQQKAKATATYRGRYGNLLVYPTLGLTGEAGEYLEKALAAVLDGAALAAAAGKTADKVKKVLRGDHDATGDCRDVADGACQPVLPGAVRQALLLELGDVLWYIGACADDLGATLEDVAEMNLHKLASRRARGVIKGSGDVR